MAKIKPCNFSITGSLLRSVAIGCEDETTGERFHIWVTDDEKPRCADSVLFKNAPVGTHKFSTRTLDQSGAIGRQLVPILLAKAAELLPAHLDAREGDKARQEANRLEAIRLQRIKEAGPELLDNLKKTVASLEYWFPRWGDPEGANSQMMQDARAIIAKAEGTT